MEQNFDESSLYLAGNGLSASAQLQEWGIGEVGLSIFHMFWSTRSWNVQLNRVGGVVMH